MSTETPEEFFYNGSYPGRENDFGMQSITVPMAIRFAREYAGSLITEQKEVLEKAFKAGEDYERGRDIMKPDPNFDEWYKQHNNG